jgi:hypothetical protein
MLAPHEAYAEKEEGIIAFHYRAFPCDGFQLMPECIPMQNTRFGALAVLRVNGEIPKFT